MTVTTTIPLGSTTTLPPPLGPLLHPLLPSSSSSSFLLSLSYSSTYPLWTPLNTQLPSTSSFSLSYSGNLLHNSTPSAPSPTLLDDLSNLRLLNDDVRLWNFVEQVVGGGEGIGGEGEGDDVEGEEGEGDDVDWKGSAVGPTMKADTTASTERRAARGGPGEEKRAAMKAKASGAPLPRARGATTAIDEERRQREERWETIRKWEEAGKKWEEAEREDSKMEEEEEIPRT